MTKVQNMFKDMHKLLMALILGNIVGAATCGFFALVQMALAVWKLPIPQTIVSFDEVQYSTTLAMFMLGGGLLAGVIFSRLEGPRSHGPGDLMLAIHKDHDPDLKGGFLTSALTLVSSASANRSSSSSAEGAAAVELFSHGSFFFFSSALGGALEGAALAFSFALSSSAFAGFAFCSFWKGLLKPGFALPAATRCE